MNSEKLAQHRGEIDRIDREILELLNARCREAEAIGHLKDAVSAPVYSPEREREVFARLDELNSGPLAKESLHAVFRAIIAGCRGLEKRLRVACLGPEGTFSHQAVLARFSDICEAVMCPTIPAVFSAVECGRADYGVVPVENSTEGVVTVTLDRIFCSTLSVCAEILLEVHNHLVGFGPIAAIKTIYSHPQPIAQCRSFIADKFPKCKVVQTSSTAEAAHRAADEGAEAAALCSETAARAAGVPVLMENVEDMPGNTTRFLVLGRQDTRPTGHDKTSVCLGMRDRAGALIDALKPFRDAGISLSLIESRPGRVAAFEYWFFADMYGHRLDPDMAKALSAAQEVCSFVKVLGSYPRGND
ncbi:MAG: prephenate dehydratase [Victivallaceae bacterium]|nr:prephenate dehydratase [Victivallaceae bacterium]